MTEPTVIAEIDTIYELLAIIVPVGLALIGWTVVGAFEHWARSKPDYHEPPKWTFND